MPETPYGQHILTTGEGIVGQIEMVWGRFWYESRFQGKRPVADVGPGRCWFTRQNPSGIIAIDNAPDLVEYYSAQQLKITLGSAYEIPFPDAYFEGVFCCWLFEHLPDPERAILEFHRVLKPGGLCSIVVPTPVDMVAFIGFSELLYDGKLGMLPARPRECLGRIHASASHLLQLINGIQIGRAS